MFPLLLITRRNAASPNSFVVQGCWVCTPSTCGLCEAPGYYYGTSASLSCLTCPDEKSSTCDRASGLSLTCAKYYGVLNGKCEPIMFSRFTGTGLSGQDLSGSNGITSEFLCTQKCGDLNPLGGNYGSFTYTLSAGWCGCKSVATVATGLTYYNGNTLLVGECSNYPYRKCFFFSSSSLFFSAIF